MEAVSKIIEIEEGQERRKLPPTYARRRRGYVAREPEWLASHEALSQTGERWRDRGRSQKPLQDLLSSFK